MTIKGEYAGLLEHLGETVTIDEAHREHRRQDLVALRHDVDHDLDLALDMAQLEHERGCRATYFLLHTHRYWSDPFLADKCLQLIAYGHEVGLHLNALTEWFDGTIDDVGAYVRDLLRALREAGVRIVGTSAHGDRACYEHQFINYWIWRELRTADPAFNENGRSAEGVHVENTGHRLPYPESHTLTREDGATFDLWSVSMTECGLTYDAIHVPHDHYWTDTGGSWSRSDDPRRHDLSTGRHQVLVHPFWWRDTPRRIVILTTTTDESTALADLINRSTSYETAPNAINAATPVDLSRPQPRETVIRELRASLNAWSTSTRSAIDVTDDLDPIIPDIRRMAPGVEVWQTTATPAELLRNAMQHAGGRPDVSSIDTLCGRARRTRDMRETFATGPRLDVDATGVGVLSALAANGITIHPMLAERAMRTFGQRRGVHAPRLLRRLLRRATPNSPDVDALTSVEHAALDKAFAKTAERPVQTLIDSETSSLAAAALRNVDAVHSVDGLGLRTLSRRTSASYALWPGGTWNDVGDDPWRCEHDRVHLLSLRAVPDERAVARIFIIWYDATGQRSYAEHIGSLDVTQPDHRSIFMPPHDAGSLAIGIHLGLQSPRNVITIQHMRLTTHPLGRSLPRDDAMNGDGDGDEETDSGEVQVATRPALSRA